MSNTTKKATEKPQEAPANFVFARVGDIYYRFAALEQVPAELKNTVIVSDELSEYSLDKLGALYGQIAGTAAKNFKKPEMAISSIAVQVARLPEFTEKALAPTPVTNGVKRAYVRHAKGIFSFCILQNAEEILGKLPPQAQTLFKLVTADSNHLEWQEDELKSFLSDKSKELRTQQSPWRIFQYYRPTFISKDLLRTK